MINTIEKIAAGTAVLGVVLISIPNIWGLYLITIAQIFWGIFAYNKENKFLLIQSIVLLLINFFAIYNWTIKGVG